MIANSSAMAAGTTSDEDRAANAEAAGYPTALGESRYVMPLSRHRSDGAASRREGSGKAPVRPAEPTRNVIIAATEEVQLSHSRVYRILPFRFVRGYERLRPLYAEETA